MVDSIYRTRSLGVAAVGLPDQYADGKAAKVWQLYIGDTKSRTEEYRSWLVSLLKQQSCKTVLDVACGTGASMWLELLQKILRLLLRHSLNLRGRNAIQPVDSLSVKFRNSLCHVVKQLASSLHFNLRRTQAVY